MGAVDALHVAAVQAAANQEHGLGLKRQAARFILSPDGDKLLAHLFHRNVGVVHHELFEAGAHFTDRIPELGFVPRGDGVLPQADLRGAEDGKQQVHRHVRLTVG